MNFKSAQRLDWIEFRIHGFYRCEVYFFSFSDETNNFCCVNHKDNEKFWNDGRGTGDNVNEYRVFCSKSASSTTWVESFKKIWAPKSQNYEKRLKTKIERLSKFEIILKVSQKWLEILVLLVAYILNRLRRCCQHHVGDGCWKRSMLLTTLRCKERNELLKIDSLY